MNHYSIILYTISIIFFSGFSNLKAEDKEILSSEEHCVAYATPEKILFFPEYLVIGKSCKVEALLENNYDNKLRFRVNIPADSLNSGISARDDDVMDILEANNYPNIFFETVWLSEDEVKKIILNEKGEVNGVLKLSGQEYPISFNIIVYKNISKYSFKATIDSTYTFFNIDPPKFGIFAQVSNKIKIIVNLQSDQITGFEKVIYKE